VRTAWERAKQKADELGLAKSAYYPELESLAVFGDERLMNPFPKPLAPRGYVMVEVPSSGLMSRSNISSLTLVNAKRTWTPRKKKNSPRVQMSFR
jgi:hypothetical protein